MCDMSNLKMLTDCSGAQTPALVPVLMQQGYSAIAVCFDVWGLANMLSDGLKEGRALVLKGSETAAAGANGKNGVDNGEEKEVVNGKAPPS